MSSLRTGGVLCTLGLGAEDGSGATIASGEANN